jgi:hypothetical protein
LGNRVRPLDSIHELAYDCVVVSSYLDKDKIQQALLHQGVSKKNIRMIF